MAKTLLTPTLDNALKILGERLNDFKGESRRSYRKAYSSFQLYVTGHYNLSEPFSANIIDNWVTSSFLQGLSAKTISFYIDKISSLYSGSAHKLQGGKTSLFKDLKRRLKDFNPSSNSVEPLQQCGQRVARIWQRRNDAYSSPETVLFLKSLIRGGSLPDDPALSPHEINRVKEFIKSEGWEIGEDLNEGLSIIWAHLALQAGVEPDIVKGMVPNAENHLKALSLIQGTVADDQQRDTAIKKTAEYIAGEPLKWFAMRLRPKVKFQSLLDRFAAIEHSVKMPQLFYPFQEIAKKTGGKVIWEGKPVIRDIVFFRSRKSEIYKMFTMLYDLAWCYRNPGIGPGNYAVIPAAAMHDFMEALDFLEPGMEVAPAGKMPLRRGDEVVIVDGEYARMKAKITKIPGNDDKKIYRVTLLNQNGHWDIGIDARKLKKK